MGLLRGINKFKFTEVVQMNEQVKEYIDKYPREIIDMYCDSIEPQ